MRIAEASRVVAAVVAASSCASPRVDPPAASPAAASSDAALEALYRARVDSTLARFTPADSDFMALMIGHHGQALAMAALAPERAASGQISSLAARITTAQESEIRLMRQWLEDRGMPAPEHGGARDTGSAGTATSHGMLTPEQMRSLRDADGVEFDRRFLALMIRHHEGAVTMVEHLFATPGAAQDASTFRIASGIQVDQRSEIARMKSMLDGLREPRRRP